MSEFTLPLRAPDVGHTVSFKVEWGDGSTEVIGYDLTSYNNDTGTLLKHDYTGSMPAGGWTIKIYPPSGEKFGKYWGYPDGSSKGYADRTKLKEIKKWGCFEFNNLGYSFAGCSNLNISATDTTINPAKPSFYPSSLDSAFKNCTSLNPVGISAAAETAFNSFNTLAAVSMNHTFKGCTSFNTNINGWNVLSVTNFNSTFAGAASFNPSNGLNDWTLKTLPSGSGISMQSTFFEATSFNKPLDNWDTSRVINLTNAFNLAEAFDQDLSGWNVSNVTSMARMFELATSFNNNNAAMDWGNNDGGAASWELTNMSNMFLGASGFNQSPGTWNTEAVTNLDATFSGATNFNQDLSSWNIANVTTATDMFSASGQSDANAEATNTSWQAQDSSSPAAQESQSMDVFTPADRAELKTAVDAYCADNAAGEATYGHINTWNTSNITDMSQLFQQKQTFNSDMFNWDVSNVTTMERMFSGAYAFNAPIGTWNVSKVENMEYMFNYTYAFNQNLNLWDTSSVTNMKGTFDNAFAFDGNIGTWDTSNVTTMDSIFRDQNSTGAFNQDISMKSVTQNGRTYDAWDTGNVTNMNHAFYGQASFDQPIGNWDTSKVTNMSFMFGTAYAFNQPLNSWYVLSVTSMNGMFYDATAFDQPLSNWSTDNVSIFEKVFRGATNFNQPIDQWNTDSATSMEQMFEKATNFNQDIGSWNTSSVTKMDSMFKEASAFNQDLSGWVITSINSASNMFLDSGQSGANAEATNASWQTQDSSSPAAQESATVAVLQLTLMMAGSILMKAWANTGAAHPSSNIEMIGWETEAEICVGVGGASTAVFTADGNVEAGDLLYVTNIDYGASIGDSVTQAESEWKEVRSAFPEDTATTTVNGTSGGWVLRYEGASGIYKALSLETYKDHNGVFTGSFDPHTVISVGDCASAATSNIRLVLVLDPTHGQGAGPNPGGAIPTLMGEIQLTINGVIQQPWGDSTSEAGYAAGSNRMSFYSVEPGTLVQVESIPTAGSTMSVLYASGGTFSDGQSAITQTSSSFTMPDSIHGPMIVGAAYY
jgi:surface protein